MWSTNNNYCVGVGAVRVACILQIANCLPFVFLPLHMCQHSILILVGSYAIYVCIISSFRGFLSLCFKHAYFRLCHLHVATMPPRDLRNFLLTLGERWVEFAKYLGFTSDEIAAITDNYPYSVGKQVRTRSSSYDSMYMYMYVHVHA